MAMHGKEIPRPENFPETAAPSEAYLRAKEVLGERKFLFFVIQPESLGQLIDENEEHFSPFTSVGLHPVIRDFVPETIEIALGPEVKLPKSNNLSQARQIEMIAEYGQKLKEETGLDSIEVRMGHAVEYAQADIAHKKQTGNNLFPDFFACAEKTDDFHAACVGHICPTFPLGVNGLVAYLGNPFGWAVPLVVLPRKGNR